MIQFGCMIIRQQVCFDSLVRFRRPSIQRKPGAGLSLQSQPGNAKQALRSFRKYAQRFWSRPLDKQINHKSVVMSSTSTTITRTLTPWGLCKLQDEAWSKQPAGSSWKKAATEHPNNLPIWWTEVKVLTSLQKLPKNMSSLFCSL